MHGVCVFARCCLLYLRWTGLRASNCRGTNQVGAAISSKHLELHRQWIEKAMGQNPRALAEVAARPNCIISLLALVHDMVPGKGTA